MTTRYDLIIFNGIVVTDTEIGDYDIAIKDEKIAKVAKRGELKGSQAVRTIDAGGGYVMVLFTDGSLDRKLTV
jgi:dihydropyrimidinase